MSELKRKSENTELQLEQPMKRKKKYWGSDGTDPLENYYTHRTRVLTLLQNIITKETKVPIPWILLRAPYASSKTSLMQASHKYFEDFQVISVSMLCSSNCKNDTFSTWLLEHADVGPDRQRIKTGPDNFYSLLKKNAFSKPVLLWFDEVQLIYSANYAISFLETLKRIITEHSSWNVKAIIFSGVYEDFVPNRGSPADITHRFGADVLYFDMEEIAELIEDFNNHNADFHISPQIVNELHKATGGHPGFVIQCLRNIEEMSLKSKKHKFESEDWIRWKTLHFKTAINNSRTAQQLNNFYIENPGWQQIVQQLFMKEPARLASNDLTNRLIKSGLICQAPGTLDQFTFGSPAIRMLLFEALLGPTLKERPIYRWFDKMIDFLTVSIPLMDDKLITNCLSTTIRNRQKTWKEAVWQNHFFASLYRMIPNSYSIDPEYSDSGGRVDYYVHGEDNEKQQFSGSIEFLITEFENEPIQSELDYILKHYYRFVPAPDPKKRLKFPQTYKLLAEEPFIVVNVSHKRPNIQIEGQLPMTYADLIIDDTLHTMTLYIDNFVLPVTMGVPTLLNLTTKKMEDFDIRKYTPRLIDETKWKITVNINQVPTRIPISPNFTINDLKNFVKERDSTIKEPFEIYEKDIKLFAKDTISEVIKDGAVLTVKQLMETDVSSNVQ